MITDYFDVYRKKVDIKNLNKLIKDKELKLQEYEEFLNSSAGTSLLINRLISRNHILTEKNKLQDEEEKQKIENDYAIEFLAFNDLEANSSKSFINAMKEELKKYLVVYTNNDNKLEINRNLDCLTLSAIKEDDKSFAYKFSKLINELFYSVDENNNKQDIKLSNFMGAKNVKDLYKFIMNKLYRESLNVVTVDYMKGSSNTERVVVPNNSNINSIPAGI